MDNVVQIGQAVASIGLTGALAIAVVYLLRELKETQKRLETVITSRYERAEKMVDRQTDEDEKIIDYIAGHFPAAPG